MSEQGAVERIDSLRYVGRLADAEQLIRTALATQPQEAALLWRLAAVLLGLHRVPEGLAAAEASVGADPSNSNGHRLRALLLVEDGRVNDAVGAAESAVALTPDHAHTLVVYAYVLECARRYPEAVVAARRAVELAPHDPETHLRLGEVARAMGDRTTARAQYHESLRLDPDYAEANRQLALLDEGRHPGRALRRLITTGRHRPDLPGLLGSVAKLLWRVGARLRFVFVVAVLPVVSIADYDVLTLHSTWSARVAALVLLAAAAAVLWREARHLPDGTRPVVVAALRSDFSLLALWVAVALCVAGYVAVVITGIAALAATTWLVVLVVNAPVLYFLDSLRWPWHRRPSTPEPVSVPEFLSTCSLELRVFLALAVLLVLAVGDPTKAHEEWIPTTPARIGAGVVLAVTAVGTWRGARHLVGTPQRAVRDALRASGPLLFRWLTVGAALGVYVTVAVTGYAYQAMYVWAIVLASGLILAVTSRAAR